MTERLKRTHDQIEKDHLELDDMLRELSHDLRLVEEDYEGLADLKKSYVELREVLDAKGVAAFTEKYNELKRMVDDAPKKKKLVEKHTPDWHQSK